MALQEKYVNPFTDFGFKKLFGSEPNLEDNFAKLFATAELAKFNREEMMQYEQSLKYYRDLKNVIDTAFDEGDAKRKVKVVLEALREGLPLPLIAKLTELTEAEIKALRDTPET
jgi:hypothetical protein